ncbi:MAG: hypothetical protein AB8I08_14740 [Sandaracinaceae bacterium]
MPARLLTVLALTAIAAPVSAQPSRGVQPTLIVEGSVLEVQTGVPACGVLATSVWARVRIDRLLTPLGGLLPEEITVQVQCPGTVNVGERHRFELVSPRPRRGSWSAFADEPPSNPARYWVLRTSALTARR